MLTKTSETAIRALLFMVVHDRGQTTTPRQIAEAIDASPTYLVKTMRLLVKSGILRSHRGAHGGVELAREPERITLLEVMEACQGLLVGNYCSALGREEIWGVCGFHQAMQEVYDVTVGTLSRWTLADLAKRPGPTNPEFDACQCKMAFACADTKHGQAVQPGESS